MVEGGTNIRQFANAGTSKKKSPIRRPCVVDTCMEVDVTTANFSITDGVDTSYNCQRWGRCLSHQLLQFARQN